MIKANHRRVRRLTPGEVWLFIIGRVLVAFGVGILAARYFPEAAGMLALPAVLVGVLCLVVAGRGMLRPASQGE